MDDSMIADRLRRLPDAVDPDPDFEAGLRERLIAELGAPGRRDVVRMLPVDEDLTPSQQRGRRWLLSSAAAVVAISLAVAIAIRSGDEAGPVEPADSVPSPITLPTPSPTTVAVLPSASEPTSAHVETIAIETGGNAYRVAADDRYLWSMSLNGDLKRIDAKTLEITGTLKLPDSSEIAAGAGALWFAGALDGQILKIDPDTLEVVGRIRTGVDLNHEAWRALGVGMYQGARRTFAAIGGLAVNDTTVWVGDHAGAVVGYDTTTLAEVERLEVGVRPDIVRVNDELVLAAAYRDDVVEVYRRDGGGLVARIDGVGALLGATLSNEAAFAHDIATGVVTRLDLATGELIRNDQLDAPPVFDGLQVYSAGPAVAADALFVDVAGGVALLDPGSLELIATVDLAGQGGEASVTPAGAGLVARYTDRSINLITPPTG